MSNLSKIKVDNETYNIQDRISGYFNKPNYNSPIILSDNGSTTSGVWKVTTDSISSLEDGQLFMYKLVVAGASTTTVQMTLNGVLQSDKTIYRCGSTKLTTQYGVGAWITFYYSSSLNNGSFIMVDGYDSTDDGNYLDREYYYTPICADALYRYKICGVDQYGRLSPLTLTNQSNATMVTKTCTGRWIRPDLFYHYITTTTKQAGATVSAATLVNRTYTSSYATYNFNTVLSAKSDIYLKGIYDSKTGLFKLYHDTENTAYDDWYVQVPQSVITYSSYFNTGYYYIYLLSTYTTDGYYNFMSNHPMYYFDGTNLRRVERVCTEKIPDTDIGWGSTETITNAISPLDAGMCAEFGANRLALADPSGVTVEWSRDSGSTWTAYNLNNNQKINLVSGVATTCYIGGRSSGNTVDDMLRITLDGTSMNVYFIIRKLFIFCGTGTAGGLTLKIEKSTRTEPDTYQLVAQNIQLAGNSGWNSVPQLNNTYFGSTQSASSRFQRIRLTFSIPSAGYAYIQKIMMTGESCWTTNSTMALTGHLYSWDYSKNAVFPGAVEATNTLYHLTNTITQDTIWWTNGPSIASTLGLRTFRVRCDQNITSSTSISIVKKVPNDMMDGFTMRNADGTPYVLTINSSFPPWLLITVDFGTKSIWVH